jgi:glycine hydroxymethyltransferase
MSYLQKYFSNTSEDKRDPAAVAFTASLDAVSQVFPEIAQSTLQELRDQRSHLKLIASENYSSLAVQLAMGNLLSDKYSEGYAHHRFYAGCENVDAIEERGVELAKKIFGADHAYIQPHSGADANLVAFWSILVTKVQNKEIERLGKKSLEELTVEEYESVRQLLVNQKVMGMSLESGGHLTHGYRHNVSSKIMKAVHYGTDPKTGLLDYSAIEKQVVKEKPLILIAGYSAYPRLIDFAKMREIADKAGSVLMVDMAHFAGLVAGKAMTGNFNPVPFAHIVTSTTHKTLRGPRGGLILCQNEFKEAVDKGCPIVLGGPLPHVMAAKAVAFKEAEKPSFAQYAAQIVKNSKALAEELKKQGAQVLTGGTDNHLVLIDVESSYRLTGRQAELALRQAKLTVNRNMIPLDKHGPWYTSGVRIGTPAVTTLGMREGEMRRIAEILALLLKHTKPAINQKTGQPSLAQVEIEPKALEKAKAQVHELLKGFPLYPEIGID